METIRLKFGTQFKLFHRGVDGQRNGGAEILKEVFAKNVLEVKSEESEAGS